MSAPVLSVMMSTCSSDNPAYLPIALESILNQTQKADKIVIVKDGPLSADLEKTLALYQSRPEIEIVSIEQRGGLAKAMNVALEHCHSEFVARMDADDISTPQRFEKQLQMFRNNPELDLVASWHGEFTSSAPEEIFAIKKAPADFEELKRALKWRCVLSHPTIIVRREMLNKVGGYRSGVGKLEDWDLYMRLISNQCKLSVFQGILVKVRVDQAQRARRTGFQHFFSDLRFKWDCWKRGNLDFWEWWASTLAWLTFRILPERIKTLGYKMVRARV